MREVKRPGGKVVGMYNPAPNLSIDCLNEFGRRCALTSTESSEVPGGDPGQLQDEEKYVLLGAIGQILKIWPCPTVVELGVLSGGTSQAINWWLTKWSKKYNFIGIDSFQGGGNASKQTWWKRNRRYVDSGNCRLVEGKFETVPVPTAPVHLLFIDGHHAKEAVLHDFKRFSPSVPVNGSVVFHDLATSVGPPLNYLNGGVKEALEELDLEKSGWEKRGWFLRHPPYWGGGIGVFTRTQT